MLPLQVFHGCSLRRYACSQHLDPRLRNRLTWPLDAVIANGGEVVQPIGADAPEVTARVRDPAGNVIGIYQEPAKSTPGKASLAD